MVNDTDSSNTRVFSNIPVPDPSVVTQQIIDKAVSRLREDSEKETNNLHEFVRIRLDAMDKATQLLAENVNRVPTLLDREALRLSELFSERFGSIQVQFKERDLRTDQDKTAAATAVAAALTALKEMITLQNTSNAAAIAKSEGSVTTALASLTQIIAGTKEGLTSDITNLKQRMDRNDGMAGGIQSSHSDTRANTGTFVGVIGGAVGAIALVLSLIFGIMNNTRNGNSGNSGSGSTYYPVAPVAAVAPVAPIAPR